MVSNSLRSSSLPWADKTLERLSNIVTSFSSVIRRPQELAKIQTSLTLHLNFYTLCLIAFLVTGIAWSFVRTRYLQNYSDLPDHSARITPVEQLNLFADNSSGPKNAGFHNYLDEFLSAIKVFGYLERPVFHELTRHMQTRKLLAGESINLEDEKSFCLVVDGHVQVFFKTERLSDSDDGTDEDLNEGYKLLTDVRNGQSNPEIC